MPSTLSAKFDSRRQAEMTVERLVQEFEMERTDIFIVAEGAANSAGVETDGSDKQAGEPTSPARGDAALTGRIIVSVDTQDDGKTAEIRDAFSEFGGD